jgi:amino acid transporter
MSPLPCKRALCAALALTGTFQRLAVLSAVAGLLIYFGCCAAVSQLRRRDVRAEGPPFRVPGGPLVPLLACSVVVWLLASATRAEYLAVAGMIAMASLFLCPAPFGVAR